MGDPRSLDGGWPGSGLGWDAGVSDWWGGQWVGEPRRGLGWGGILTCQTGQAGKGRVSQETWVVGNGVWGGVLKSQTGAG